MRVPVFARPFYRTGFWAAFTPKLVELAKILVWQEETKWHCLEILRRNGVLYDEMPKVDRWDWLRIHEKTGMCLVWVPPGEFMMGSGEGHDNKESLLQAKGNPSWHRSTGQSAKMSNRCKQRSIEPTGNEQPRQRVEVRDGFWIGKYAITNVEYASFMESKRVAEPLGWHDLRFNTWDQPVVGVRWGDAQGYGEWSLCGCRVKRSGNMRADRGVTGCIRLWAVKRNWGDTGGMEKDGNQEARTGWDY